MSLGTKPNRNTSLESDDDDDDEHTRLGQDEATVTLEVVSECIKSLFRTGILVRKSAPRDRFKRALQIPDLAFPAFYDIDYVKQKHPKASPEWLSNRLGGAIAKRRQFIKYCRDHRTRLGAEDAANEGLEVLATATERLSSKATTFAANKAQQTEATEKDDEDAAVSMWSASTTADTLSTLKLPRLADLSPSREAFECPICFTLQSFKHERSWQIHAFSDLKAYVCTVGGAACDSEFFSGRDSWFEHELKHHRARYCCVLCSLGPLPSNELRKHVSETHGPFPADQLEMLLDAGREATIKFKARDCPFCDEWAATLQARANPEETVHITSSRFKRHVAAHQEQLAIFAMPRAIEEKGTPGSGSVGASVSERVSLPSLSGNDTDQERAGEDIKVVLPKDTGELGKKFDIGASIEATVESIGRSVAMEPEIEKPTRFAAVEDADESDNIIEGTMRYATSSVASPTKERPNTGRKRQDKRRDSSAPLTESDSTMHPQETRDEMKEVSEKQSMRPPAKLSRTRPILTREAEASYYGVVKTTTASSQARPRRPRPVSYYGDQRPPQPNSDFYYPQAEAPPPTSPSQSQFNYYAEQQPLGQTPISFPPPPWAESIQPLYLPPSPAPIVGQQRFPDCFSRPLEDRFVSRRPVSSMGFRPPPKTGIRDEDDDEPTARRPPQDRRTPRLEDDWVAMPPPPGRPVTSRPTAIPFPPPPNTPARPEVPYEDEDEDDGVSRIEVAGHRKPHSYYGSYMGGYEDKMLQAARYQADVGGSSIPLTAEALRKAARHRNRSRSSRSPPSRDESDRQESTKAVKTTENDNDVAVRVKERTREDHVEEATPSIRQDEQWDTGITPTYPEDEG